MSRFDQPQADFQPPLSTDEELAFNVEVVVPFKRDELHMYDFTSDPFPLVEIEQDERRVAALRQTASFDREGAGAASSAEYAIMAGIKVDGWFGDELETARRTTPFDDYMHGVDFVLGFLVPGKEKSEELAVYLAVDVTSNPDVTKLQKKFDAIRAGLDRQRMSRVKYFEDVDGKRESSEMPIVVLGADRGRLMKLQRAFIHQREKVKEDPIQLEFIAEAKEQLTHWLAYILKRHRVVDPNIFIGDSATLLSMVEQRKAAIDRDAYLKKAVDAHVEALGAILRAEQIKKSLGRVQPERAGTEPASFLKSPDRWAGVA